MEVHKQITSRVQPAGGAVQVFKTLSIFLWICQHKSIVRLLNPSIPVVTMRHASFQPPIAPQLQSFPKHDHSNVTIRN